MHFSARHQLMMRDHRFWANISHDVLVYASAFADLIVSTHKNMDMLSLPGWLAS